MIALYSAIPGSSSGMATRGHQGVYARLRRAIARP
jgi:hypothetical protein